MSQAFVHVASPVASHSSAAIVLRESTYVRPFANRFTLTSWSAVHELQLPLAYAQTGEGEVAGKEKFFVYPSLCNGLKAQVCDATEAQ